jgi:adenylate cyclase
MRGKMRALGPEYQERGAGLFARLLLLALFIGVVPLVSLGFVLIDQNAEALRTSSRTLHLAIAQDVQRSLRARLGRVDEELIGIGQLLLAKDLGSDDARLALAGAKITASRAFDAVTLYLPSGERAGTIKAREVPDPDVPAQLPQKGKPGLSVGAVKHGEVLLEREIRIDGAVRGRLLAWMKLDELSRLVGELGELRLSSRDAVYVVDGSRRIVVHADPRRIGEERKGRGIFEALAGNASFASMTVGISPDFTEDGSPMLGAREPLPELNWAVVVREPRDLAYASLTRMRRVVLGFLALAAVAAALGGALAARALTRPLQRLVGATRDIAQRRFKGVGDEVSGRGDEVGDLLRRARRPWPSPTRSSSATRLLYASTRSGT